MSETLQNVNLNKDVSIIIVTGAFEAINKLLLFFSAM